MTKVYGCSDDLVIVEGVNPQEIDCYRKVVKITFEDGTVIKVRYPKRKIAVWEIQILEKGIAPFLFTPCNNENENIYSDVFEIDSKVSSFLTEAEID